MKLWIGVVIVLVLIVIIVITIAVIRKKNKQQPSPSTMPPIEASIHPDFQLPDKKAMMNKINDLYARAQSSRDAALIKRVDSICNMLDPLIG